MTQRPQLRSRQDDGYLLVGCIVLIFVVLLVLGTAAPTVARQLQREKEVESVHRAEQYVRALRVYRRKNNNYPTSIDQLKLTNNQKFLRREYTDPLTGKADWRIIHVGENKTTVKGFFGQDLPGIGGSSISGSSTGTSSSSGSGGSAFGSSGGGSGSGSAFGSGGSSPSAPATGSAFGGTGTGTASGSTLGAGGSGGSGSAFGSNGIGSQSATTASLGGGGPIMGIGSAKTGEAILTVNGEDQYENWEFLYDPRIEQLYAKGALNAGVSSGAGASVGSGIGAPTSTSGQGGSGGGSSFGSGGFGSQPSAPTTPTPTPPQ